MKSLVVAMLASIFFFMGCAHHKNLTPEERAAYKRSMDMYYMMQDGP